MLTLYNAVSIDGFIARKDGGEDFIPDEFWAYFLKLCLEYKTLIMGRKTYEAIQHYDVDSLRQFEELPIKKIVISSNINLLLKEDYALVHSPEEAFKFVPEALVCSGPILNNSLLKSGLVGKIIQCEVPTEIFEGIKPFDNTGIKLISVDIAHKINGVKVNEYNVTK